MRVIYTYKKLDHFKPIDDNFFKMCELSVLSAKKHYKTILYCDTAGKEVLASIPFDEVIVLDSLNDYSGMWYTVPKMITMSSQTEPFIHIDLDVVIFNSFDTNCDIAIGFPEFDKNLYDNIDENFIDVYYRNPMQKIFKFDLNDFDFSVIPNTSVVIGKNPSAVREIYSKILNDYKHITNLNPSEFDEIYQYSTFGIPSILDQFLFLHEINKSSYTFEFKEKLQISYFDETGAFLEGNDISYDNLEIFLDKCNFCHIQNYQDTFKNPKTLNAFKKLFI